MTYLLVVLVLAVRGHPHPWKRAVFLGCMTNVILLVSVGALLFSLAALVGLWE